MKSGYKVLWTNNAIKELKTIIKYLEINWTRKELTAFSTKLDHTIEIISKSPEIFPASFEKKEVRKAVIDKNNNLYYRIKNNTIEILSVFSNVQNPKKKKI
ncbi:MAG TPA: hypothetical protein DIU39_02090 [Flavobacteriales bacterium]|nr:hypothetical protein [Flavobacteriales bacterium]|tara:strand:- start:24094 stop:24396 length:303 start_codon:yes stop_codon:yes gene_type:complete